MTIQKTQELKRLETRQKEAKAKGRTIRQEINERKVKLDKIDEDLQKINRAMQLLRDADDRIVVTEHAILRYLQYTYGYDLDEIIGKILCDEIKEQYETLGNGKYPNGDGLVRVIKNKTVVTVVNKRSENEFRKYFK